MRAENSSRRRFLAAAAITIPGAALLGAGAMQSASGAVQPATALPDFAPVPPSAFGPKLNDRGYYVGRVNGNLYWVTDAFYQSMFLTTRTGVVLVDAPPTIGHNLLHAIDEVTRANGRPSKVTHLVYTHSHADHIGAAGIFGHNVVRVAHEETARNLRVARDSNRPLPTKTFDDHYTLRVGGERLELSYHGPNHTSDNIFVYAPEHETLMVVDVLFPGWVPFKGLGDSHAIGGWVQAHQEIMRYPWKTFVGGHLGRLGTRADADLQKQYVDDLATAAKAALAGVDPTPYFEKYSSTGNAWAIFDAYLDEATRRTAEPVIAKYTGVLAAADVFTADSAFTMLQSLRIDSGILGPFGVRPS
ncbi:MBL fold metallo-hydrolase [Kribbella sp. NPDC051620]|uniref:MBL fold metallo-hydrolase n=1 Tax=Kribbella sp. NPDC051620 TaxID=3364120 RepID=UPI00378953EE